MGILPGCFHPPLGKFPKKRAVATLPKDVLQTSRWLQEPTNVSHASYRQSCLPGRILYHAAWTLLEELGLLHKCGCVCERSSLTGGAHGQYFVPKAVLQPTSPGTVSRHVLLQGPSQFPPSAELSPIVTVSLFLVSNLIPCAQLKYRHWGAVI